jgi:glycosyltransferase involved in cell wall biosynthesis
MLYERGMPMEELWRIYAASDVFLITPKAEGAGLPVLESMAIGLPVIGTDCCAIHEHLSDGRGYLIPPAFSVIDPFMNGNRFYVSTEAGVRVLEEVYHLWDSDSLKLDEVRERAYKYIEGRSWSRSTDVLENVLKNIKGGKDVETKTPDDGNKPEGIIQTGL